MIKINFEGKGLIFKSKLDIKKIFTQSSFLLINFLMSSKLNVSRTTNLFEFFVICFKGGFHRFSSRKLTNV